MRFVDREQCDVDARQPFQCALLHQPFWRDIQKLQFPSFQPALDIDHFIEGLRGVEEGSSDAGSFQGRHLILHQGDEGRYHDADTAPDKRGDLVAQRLASARRHQH